MPKLWDETIEAHRRAVREAALDATAVLVADRGLAAVTMSEIAEATGVGRATLYKYFPDLEAILLAWHRRQVAAHLELLAAARDRASGPWARLEAVLVAYASVSHPHHHGELAAFLHRHDHVADAHRRLSAFVRDLLTEGAAAGHVRRDVPAEELAAYCLTALAAVAGMPSAAAVGRLVAVILRGLQPSDAP